MPSTTFITPLKATLRMAILAMAVAIATTVVFPQMPAAAQNQTTTRNDSKRFINIDVDSLVMAICREEGTSRIGGIWTATTDGATIGIVPAKAWHKTTGMTIPRQNHTLAEQWVMILLDSPDPMLQPGILMGWLSPAAKPAHYTASIYTKRKKNHLASPQQFVLHLADDGHLIMQAIRKGIVINPWRLLPYMVRGSVKYRDETPRDLDGFLKKWPVPRNPQNPRYL